MDEPSNHSLPSPCGNILSRPEGLSTVATLSTFALRKRESPPFPRGRHRPLFLVFDTAVRRLFMITYFGAVSLSPRLGMGSRFIR